MKYPVSISGKDYTVYHEVLADGIVTSASNNIVLALVVPDKIAEGGTVDETILNFNCKGNRVEMQRKLESDLYALTDKFKDRSGEINISAATRDIVNTMAAGSKAIIAFVGIYLGLIFLITSAAILALQQLSETAYNRMRYDI